ncbi:MAG: hypothetical protein M0Q88_00910 [Bacilli bacterium]|nr:hypothetical protein [Bacilli bacterium]
MATIKVKRKENTDTAGSLVHGELGVTQNKLFYGNQAGSSVAVATESHTHSAEDITGGILSGLERVIIGYNTAQQIEMASSSVGPIYLRTSSGKLTLKNGGDSVYSPVATEQFVSNTNISISKIVTGSSHTDILIGTPEGGIGTLSQSTFLLSGGTAADSSKLGGQLPSHYLNYNNLDNKPTALKNPSSLTIKQDNVTLGTYDGSSAQTINIETDIYAPASHTHSATEITSGTLTVARGGTGRTSYTSGQVLYASGTSTIGMLSRSGIDTRTSFPTSIPNVAGLSEELNLLSAGRLNLIRTRAATTSLTTVSSGDTIGSVPLLSSVTRGDTLLIELNMGSSYTYSHKYIMVTLGTDSTSPNDTNNYRNFSFSTFNRTDFNIYSFTVSASGSTLYFGSKKYLKGVFSGTTIAWTTANYTLYVGKVWKVT